MNYSVIIPIYNAEKYLEECLQSISKQNRDDVEIVLVNDGSIDSSLEICENFCKTNLNVKLINKENGGIMDTWIKGVENANGKYVCFVDSDDLISDDFFSSLDEYIKEEYDIILFDHNKFYKNKIIERKVNFITYGKHKEEELNELKMNFFLRKNYLKYSLYRWDKIIKLDVIKKTISELKKKPVYAEDHTVSYLNLINSNSLYYLKKSLYNYRVRKSSITHDVVKERVFSDINDVEEEMIDIIKRYHYNDENIYNIHLYFLHQYARWALKYNGKAPRKKVKLKDVIKIDSNNKRILLLLYKFSKYLITSIDFLAIL